MNGFHRVVAGAWLLLLGCQTGIEPEVHRTVRGGSTASQASSAPVAEQEPPALPRAPEPSVDGLPVPSSTPALPVPSASGSARPAPDADPRLISVVAEPGRVVEFSPPMAQLTLRVPAQAQAWVVNHVDVSVREKLHDVWTDGLLDPTRTPVVIPPDTTVTANTPAIFALDMLDAVVRPAFSASLRGVLPTDVVVTLTLFTTPSLSDRGGPVKVDIRFLPATSLDAP